MILAANAVASINDITAAELAPLLPRVAAFDPVVAAALAAGRMRVCSTGTATPSLLQLDLTVCSQCTDVPVYPCTVAVSLPQAWPLVPFSARPDCLLTVYRCTRVPVHSRCILPPWPGHSFPLQLDLNACSQCTGVPVYSHGILLLPGLARLN